MPEPPFSCAVPLTLPDFHMHAEQISNFCQVLKKYQSCWHVWRDLQKKKTIDLDQFSWSGLGGGGGPEIILYLYLKKNYNQKF